MADWQQAGGRIKRDWVAMLEGMRGAAGGEVKIPFVPLRVSGRSLRAVLAEVLPVILGRNPSLLTLIRDGGRAAKAYAEDATSGVYETLKPLAVEPDDSRETLLARAGGAGVAVGVTKEADVRFFEPFAVEPDDFVDAIALLAAEGARALRDGLMTFHPPIWPAELVKGFALGRDSTARLLRALLPDGRYGIGLVCERSSVGLTIDVAGGAWRLAEVPVPDGLRPGRVARHLVDAAACGLAVAVRLRDVRRLADGELTLEAFIGLRGPGWDVVTRSGLEGALRLVPSIVRVLDLEGDLAACNVNLASIMKLVRGYAASAAAYARSRGIALRLTDGNRTHRLAIDATGLHEYPAGDADAGALAFDLAHVRSALAAASSDPTARLRDFVPREVMDEARYSTAVCVLACASPPGRLFVFGGPHAFFDRAWTGDACAVHLDARGRAEVVELPGTALEIHDGGARVRLASPGAAVDLAFERTAALASRHGPGRLFGDERLADWLPGLEVERTAWVLSSGTARIGGRDLRLAAGRMFLESGRGRLLHWPFGATWHYASWLDPDGACGSMVRAMPMLGNATPVWWRRVVEETTDGAASLAPGEPAALGEHEFAVALEPGPPPRVVRAAALVRGRQLAYRVLSAALVPFDEDGQVILRLRCLVGEGAGLVEVPVGLPGYALGAAACELAFSDGRISVRAGGREVFGIETQGAPFLAPYAPPAGVVARIARWLGGA